MKKKNVGFTWEVHMDPTKSTVTTDLEPGKKGVFGSAFPRGFQSRKPLGENIWCLVYTFELAFPKCQHSEC